MYIGKQRFMDSKLTQKKCVPCEGGVDPLKGERLVAYSRLIHDQWSVVDEHHLVREFRFNDFLEALTFTNRVGALAEQEGHHPDILLSYGKVGITLWTHAIDGISENDFILAAKVDQL
jgi:4a-hydroxytetrahydrobiopterin dehydratase